MPFENHWKFSQSWKSESRHVRANYISHSFSVSPSHKKQINKNETHIGLSIPNSNSSRHIIQSGPHLEINCISHRGHIAYRTTQFAFYFYYAFVRIESLLKNHTLHDNESMAQNIELVGIAIRVRNKKECNDT